MSFPAYPRYKHSGVELLGEFPDHWTLKRFKNVFLERAERSSDGTEELLSVSAYFGIKPRSETLDEGDHLSRAESLEGYKVCQAGDLVINIMLAWNRGLGFSWQRGIVSPAYCVFYVADGSVPKFLDYLVRSDDYIRYFKTHSAGIMDSRLRLYPESFGRLFTAIPSVCEQAQIARFLDHETARIDVLIEEQQRLIELLKEKRQAVISHAVTKGLDPTVPMKDSGVEWLGEVPAHWELTRVGWQCIVGNGCTPARDNQGYWDYGHYPWLNSSKVNLERVVEADQFVTSKALKECALPIVKPGSVLMAITGEGKTRGMVTITEIEATINQHVAFIEPRGSELLPAFLHDWLKANYSRLRHDSADWGSTKAAITCSDIRAYPLPLPPLAEQEAICQFVDSKSSLLDELIFSADENVSLLYERRSALISAAVTGKIDVRGWQPPASAPTPELVQEAV